MLSNDIVATTEPRAKAYKLADERSMHLFVSPTGAKSFRLKYRFGGKEKLLVLGRYPHICLDEARLRAGRARQQIADGIDPMRRQVSSPIVSESDLAALPLPASGSQWVYFAQACTGHIKIGTSSNVAHRLKAFQAGQPEPIALLATARGGYEHEAVLHQIFARERDHGEWFTPSPRLVALIDAVAASEGWPC